MGVQNAMKAYQKNVKRVKTVNTPKDKIEISDRARDIQTARKAIEALPDTRQEKIDQVKTLLKSGEYKPSANDILEKMLVK